MDDLLDKLLDKLSFLEKWFPEGVPLDFLDPLVRLIGMGESPEKGRLVVLAGLAAILVIAVLLIGRAVRGGKKWEEVSEETGREAAEAPEPVPEPEPRRPMEEIEADLEAAVEALPELEEIEDVEVPPVSEVPPATPEAVEAPTEIPPEPEIPEAPEIPPAPEPEPVPEPAVEEPPAAEPELAVPPPEEEPLTKEGLFARLRKGLSKTKDGLLGRIDSLVAGRKIDDDLFEELEEVLIHSDMGVRTTYALLEKLQEKADRGELQDGAALKEQLKEEIRRILVSESAPLDLTAAKPFVMLVSGVNGVGKTTTIGKLAKRFTDQGLSTMLVAADTFRAAAVEQLKIWADRVGAEFVSQQSGADPSAVAFDGVSAAVARGIDVVIVDTAGRLHTKANLMEEIKKVKRTIGKKLEGAPHETVLVLDATTGQNAIQQAKQFDDALGLTGLILTKLDGTAKGGVIVGISDEMKVPVRFIGIGERLDDLREFVPREFVDALFAE